MATPMTTAELQQAQTMIDAGDLAGFYSYMADQGYNYALLAGGLVSGSSFSGAAAINFLLGSAQAQGVNFTASQLPALETAMATAWVSALERVAGPDGTVSSDLNYQQTLGFHSEVLSTFHLTENAWTLAAPGQMLGFQFMESNWSQLLSDLRGSSTGPLVSEALLMQAMVAAALDSEDFSPQQTALANGWLSTNMLNIKSDAQLSFASLFQNTAQAGQVTETADGWQETLYTDGANVTLTHYQNTISDVYGVPQYTETENVWSLPVTSPAISVAVLDNGMTLNTEGGASATISSPGTVSVSNSAVTLGAGDSGTSDQVALAGSGNVVSLQSNGLSATVTGSSNVVNSPLSGNAFTLDGSDNQFNGSGDVLLLAQNSATDIVGNNNIVTNVSGSADVSGSNNEVNVSGPGASANVDGGANTISVGSGASGTMITLEGTGTSADTLSVAAGVTGVSADLGDTTTVLDLGSGTSLAIDSLNGGGTVVGTTSDNAMLSGNNITLDATGGQYSLTGDGDIANASNSYISVASGSQATVIGSDDVLSGSTSDNITLDGSGDNATAGTGSTITVNGQNDSIAASGSTIDLAADTRATIAGTGDSVVASQGDVIYLSNATITLSADSTVTIDGSDDIIVGAASDTINVSGANNFFSLSGGDTLTFDEADSSGSVTGTGTGNTLIENGTGDTVTVTGNGFTLYGDVAQDSYSVAGGTGDIASLSSNDTLTLNGANSSASVIGSGTGNTLIENGTGDTATVTGNGFTLYGDAAQDSYTIASGGADIANLSSSDTITLDGADSNASVFGYGTGNTLIENGADDSMAVVGSDFTMYGDVANDTFTVDSGTNEIASLSSHDIVTLDGAYSSASISSGGSDNTLIENGTGDAVTVTGSHFVMYGDVAQDSYTVGAGTDETVYLSSNDVMTVDGAYSDDHVIGSGTGNELIENGIGDDMTASGNDFTMYGDVGDDIYTSGGSGDTLNGLGVSEGATYDVDSYGNVSDEGDLNGGGGGYYGGYGYYGDYGFAGKQSVVNAALGSNIGSIAQYDLSIGDHAGAAAAEAGFHQAQAMANATPTASTGTSVDSGQQWAAGVITWGLAANMGGQYDAEMEQAFATWSAATGLTFEEVSGSAPADIQIGFSELSSVTTGIVGYTGYQANKGQILAATIQLEDPTQDALLPGADGHRTYSGADATLEQVLLHEIGHALGLADDSDQDSIMYYELTSSNQALDSTDIAGIQALYGTPSSTGQSAPTTASTTSNSQISVDDQLGQLIARMASFNTRAAGATTVLYGDHDHHPLSLATSVH